jgi:hypothetical protein
MYVCANVHSGAPGQPVVLACPSQLAAACNDVVPRRTAYSAYVTADMSDHVMSGPAMGLPRVVQPETLPRIGRATGT